MKNSSRSHTKSSQADVIVTILLILVSIVAVAIVASFVINLVQNNLKSTDCFKTACQFNINLENEYSYFNATSQYAFVSISRGTEEFNLTGLVISLGTRQTSKAYTIKASDVGSEVRMFDGSSTIILPEPSETRTYRIGPFTDLNATNVKITPIFFPDKKCSEGSDEQTLVVKY